MTTIDEMITSLRRLGDEEKVASAVAERGKTTLLEAIIAQISAGNSPNGTPWAPKKGGGIAYADAQKGLSSKAFGPLIRVSLTGHAAYGHFGVVGRMPPRPMLPDAGAGMPVLVTEALDKAWAQVFAEWTNE